ncbi:MULTISPECIES: AAA family ATPase [unclassified Nocardia]|uniref:bifunctional aminoglycoside phosphotransferase/ATP-binding protein n=1 Tax=unclassified Nocardia TaxID=2637762 RepID=UPI001CE430BF|nr:MULTISPECIES: AAA family ATPase [unclassified Nocardia]
MPEFAAPAQVRETHTGLVLLYGDRAYKIKKAIRTDFLDFGTPELRERACAREVGLNRRLAPDVYLGVAHLTSPTGGPDEPVVVMRRMPEDRRLTTVLADPERVGAELTALVQVLALFHHSARRGPEIDAEGRPDALRTRWQILLHGLGEQPADIVDPALLARIDELAMRYIDGREPLLHNRIAEGNLLDGHGDLLAEDIFALPDGFRVLDCLDFDDRLRYVDRIDDIAFLAMDLEFLGHADLSERLLDDYLAITGDRSPASLRHHYIAYRASVRAKVDTIRFAQGELAARHRAHRHLRIALDHLEAAEVRLMLVGGLPGTGKSTVARELSSATGAVTLSADRLRRELRATGEVTGATGLLDAGTYSAAAKARVYTELRTRAHALLTAGVSVIMDASWIAPDERRRAAELAAAAHAELRQIRCVCPATVANHRLRDRAAGDSDATPAIAAAMAAEAADWPGATVIDTGRPLPDTLTDALREWYADPAKTRDFGPESEVERPCVGGKISVG